jgi:hypothetical protein
MLPGFHCMGFFWQLLYPLVTGNPVAIFTPQHPNPPIIPTPSLLLESFIQSNVKAAFVVPAFLEVHPSTSDMTGIDGFLFRPGYINQHLSASLRLWISS